MLRLLHIFVATVCFGGFLFSFVQLLTEESQTFTAEQALVQFLQHGLQFHISVWLFFTIGFLLCTALWFWRLLRWNHDSRAEPVAGPNRRPAP
jgi:hypothetical protein